ncbi:tyrosine-type recombinase/integrase [Streptomyces sp. NPDC012765]|uniref:tyrosine-type recombinase/integrase n=1 Tax=Streptomyces sp. NPDC012765 TaxID=3155249 RepID=UPI0033DEDC10
MSLTAPSETTVTGEDAEEVVDAELVDDELLPAVPAAVPARPLVDRHTILYPGDGLPTAEQAQYSRRDFEVSEATAERLKNKSSPKNTDRNYKNQRKLFREWCEAMGRVARPCTTATYVEWVAGLIAREMAPNTIQTYMSAVRTWMPEDKKPGTAEARGMLTEYRKDWGKRNRVKKAPAITDAMMRAMVDTCDLTHPIGLRDRCALLVGRGALNRRSELADLDIVDVEVEDAGIPLWIGHSKTDQEAKGEETFVPGDPDNPRYDPVQAVRDWLSCLHRMGVTEGPLLRALTSRGTLQNRDTTKERGDRVSGDAVNDWVRGRAYTAKLRNWQHITAHGLRRGGAQEIADAGGDPTKQGRWKPGSATVKKEYLDRAQSRAENPWLKVQEARRKAQEGAS